MAQIVKLTPDYIENIKQEFDKALSEQSSIADGKFTFIRSFSLGKKPATIHFTAEAYTKMVMLIQRFDKEVAWHGVAKRMDGEGDNYIIEDIDVYPQLVSGATVEMDENEYTNWFTENREDERFGFLNMQGHSHVNMGTSPSATDIDHQKTILQALPQNGFYIFVICNKRLECNARIYDMSKNIMFENDDISITIDGYDEFFADAKKLVRDRVYSPTTYQSKTPAAQTTPVAASGSKTLPPSLPAKQEIKKGGEWPKAKNQYYDSLYDDYYDDDGFRNPYYYRGY